MVNPLALRIDLSGDPTFAELIGRARETVLGAFAHAEVPYEAVVRATHPERDLSQTPIFQAMLAYHDPGQTQRPAFQPTGIECAEIRLEKDWSKFDLMLGASHRGELHTTWEYSTELFESARVERMMRHFRALSASAASGHDRRLSRLSMLSEEERATVLVRWNPISDRPAAPASIRQRIEDQVRRTPDDVAVVLGDERLTFGELDRRAMGIASALMRREIGAGSRVGILLDKSVELVAAVLGVMKAGAAYVPLDPSYPPDRLAFMVADSGPGVLLTRAGPLAALPGATVPTIVLDDLAEADGDIELGPRVEAAADDLAYVMYTSGSTGEPKGVMVTYGGLASILGAYERAYRLAELRAHLQIASFSFDVFTGDLIRALPFGAKVVLCPRDVAIDPARLHELIVREEVDAVEFVPAVAAMLFEHVERSGKRLDCLRFVAIGGEPWRTDAYARYRALLAPTARLVNSYGLTEATMDSTYFESPPETLPPAGRYVPIGRPLPNTRVYVLDGSGEPQPIGIPGELCIGGAGVSRGYLNRPELTRERFVPDPFASGQGARMYRTGDLARWLSDGTIEFLGRSDRQLKVRGFRIEPGEIESAIERCALVRDAAVTGRADANGSLALVAYLTAADPGAPPTVDEVRATVASRLPAYMVPAAWVVLDELPRTPSGKVDPGALPDPDLGRSAAARELTAPRDHRERVLVSIWREALGRGEIGIDDDFFALGGHSLLAVRLFALIEERLGARLPLASLFESSTIADQARLIDQSGARAADSHAWSSVVPLRAVGRRSPFFLVGWVGGQLIGYQKLLASFPDGVPIYGLQAPGLDGRRLPLSTIETLAAHYVEEMRRVQPRGPYYLGGFCFGGVVAFEMARQLAERGEALAMVALIDSYTRGSRPRPDHGAGRRERLAELRAIRGWERMRWLRGRAATATRRVTTPIYFGTGALALDILAATGLPRPRTPWNLVHVASRRAARRYTPRPADVRVEYFRPQAEPGDDPTPWEHLALRGVVLRPLIGPGIDHLSITNGSGVPALIGALMEALEGAAHEHDVAGGAQAMASLA